jgi:hypothetical protein
MRSNPDPFAWLRLTGEILRPTVRSSGFFPMIAFFALCILGGIPLLVLSGGNPVLIGLGAMIILPTLFSFLAIYWIKAFKDPNFCRSEQHIERMAKVQIEMMGTNKKSFSPLEIETVKLEPPTIEPGESGKLEDKKPGDQNQ